MRSTAFKCPQCGDFRFGSSRNDDGTWTRHCHGMIPIGEQQGWRACSFTWHEREDDKHLSEVDL
jgi:hypothetical protein